VDSPNSTRSFDARRKRLVRRAGALQIANLASPSVAVHTRESRVLDFTSQRTPTVEVVFYFCYQNDLSCSLLTVCLSLHDPAPVSIDENLSTVRR
jgi:hypothetical protein